MHTRVMTSGVQLLNTAPLRIARIVLSADPADAQSGVLQRDRQTDTWTNGRTDRQTDRQYVAFAAKSRKRVHWLQAMSQALAAGMQSAITSTAS